MRCLRILAEAPISPFRQHFPNPHMRSSFAAIALLAFAVSPAPTLANPHETKLANGLRVIVKEDRRAPTAVHMVWYRAGSMDEKDGTSGVAHALEHLMFKGTRTPQVGRVQQARGRSRRPRQRLHQPRLHRLFQIVPKAALPEMMKLEADRMANLTLDAKEFAAEIKVVMEERRCAPTTIRRHGCTRH
jgi:zinc protease